MVFRILLLGIIAIQILVTGSSIPTSECSNDGPLGMISGDIENWQVTASSTKREKNCKIWRGRLYQNNKRSWCPEYKSSSEWLQVDLGVLAQVTGVMSQGRADGSQFVTEFKLSYSKDGVRFVYIKDAFDNQKIFEGNTDSYTVKHNYLDETIQARFIKFHVHKWENHPSLRVEILGCQTCKRILGIPPYARLSASSYRGRKNHKACTPEYGHLFSNKAWCAKYNDTKQWLQIDVGPPTLITGLITMGRGDGRKEHWVSEYKVSYSSDGRVYKFYKDATYMDPRGSFSKHKKDYTKFTGNSDKNSKSIHYFTVPFVARYIRFHPLKWKGRMSMRVGAFGCPHVGACGKGFFRINNQSSCVANLAYQKSASISSSVNRHNKRHILNRQMSQTSRKTGQLAVDGRLQKCSKLNKDASILTVNLLDETLISGIIIHLSKNSTTFGLRRSLLNNLDQLVVYVSKWSVALVPHVIRRGMTQYTCGSVDGLNTMDHRNPQSATLESRIHIPCKQPISGRFVHVAAHELKNTWSKKFAAVICEIMIY